MTVSEHLSHAEGFRLVKAMSWGTSLLAILVGVLGVMNTMLMTVFERTHEICVLLAVGWTRGRIMRMILYESALLGLFGGVVGVAIGAIGVKVLSEAPAIRGLLQPDLSIPLLGLSVVIAVAVGIISGFIQPAQLTVTPSLACKPDESVANSLVKVFFASAFTAASAFPDSRAEPAPPAISAAELAARMDAVSQGTS